MLASPGFVEGAVAFAEKHVDRDYCAQLGPPTLTRWSLTALLLAVHGALTLG